MVLFPGSTRVYIYFEKRARKQRAPAGGPFNITFSARYAKRAPVIHLIQPRAFAFYFIFQKFFSRENTWKLSAGTSDANKLRVG